MKNILFLCIFCFSFAQIEAQCNFDDLNLANIACNNNGTPSNSSDDYITFTLNPIGTNFNSGYEFVNITGFPVPTLLDGTDALNVPYSVQTSFRTGNGTAVGTGGVYQITIVDDSGNCTASETISAPGNCSNLAPCNITSTGFANIHCSNNGTGSTGADDQIVFDLLPSGTGLGTGYNVTVSSGFSLFIFATSLPTTNLPYDVLTTFRIDEGSANGQPFDITITDNVNSACSVTITVNPGIASCSSGPDNGINLTNLVCNDNGTPSLFSDDFLTFTIQPFPPGSNLGYSAGCDLAATTLANGAPANNIPFGPPVDLRTASGIHFFAGAMIFYNDNAGGNSGFANIINPCFNPPCDITSSGLSNVACNNNGTPATAADDYITFRLRPLGDFIGTSYFVDGDGNPSATSNVNEPYPYGLIFNFRLQNGTAAAGTYNLTVTDDPTGTCTFPIVITAPGTCSTPPAPCDILNVNFLGNPSTCNDNGTPNDPNDDFFTQNIQANFINRPLTGSLQIVAGGDQIGTYSIPVGQIIGNGHTFNSVQLKADGTPTVITMNFTDDPTCSETKTGPTIQPCSTPGPACEIIGFSFANIGSCNDNGTPNNQNDDFFTVDVDVLFSNSLGGATSLILNGSDVITQVNVPAPVGVNLTHTFTGVQLRADGQITDMEAIIFNAAPICSLPGTGPAVNSCSIPSAPCSISSIDLQNKSTCNDNATSSNSTDDFFTADVVVNYTNPPTTGNLLINPTSDALGNHSVAVSNLVGNSHTFLNVPFKADGTITGITVSFSADPGCVRTSTDAAVTPCSFPPPLLTCPSAVTVSCVSEIPPVDLTSLAETHNCPGNLSLAHVNDLISNEICVNRKTLTRTYQASDACGNLATCSQIITVNDQTPPVTFCPLPVTVNCFNLLPASNFSGGTLSDNCGGVVTVALVGDVISNQTCANRLTITRTYRGIDVCGNTTICTQTITVNDQTPPTLTCPPTQTVSCVNNVPANNTALVTGLSDNCGGATPIVTFVSDVISNQTCTNRFTITRTYRGTDVCGNTATCSQIITVNDQTPPALTCPASQTVSCASNIPANNTALVTGLSDNCSGATPIVTFVSDVINNQTCTNRFILTRTYHASDACGNSATCTQIITINDQTPPTLTCPASQTVSCASNVPANNTALVTGLSDNCGGATPIVTFVSDVISNQTCTNRFTLTRTYRASDECGNSTTCTQIIIVYDQTPPTFIFVPASTIVDCHFVPSVGTPTVSDNCSSGATVNFLGEVQTPGICPILYTLTRTWQATDACGNSTTTSQIINVTDTEAPQFLALPQNTTVECGPDNAVELQNFLDNHGGAVTDDCTAVTFSYTDSPVQEDDYICGLTFQKNIRFVATDACGNAAFREASFKVTDLTPPIFSTPPQSLQLECDASRDNGETAFFDWLDSNAGLVAEDVCSEVTLEKVFIGESQGCGRTWQKAYEFHARDACGNLAKTTATFAVVDHTPPTLVCPPNDQIFLACLEDLPAADPAALTAWDCSGVTKTLQDIWTIGTGCPGWMMTVAYRYAATDDCGNEALCEQAYYVQETDHPTLACPDTIKLTCVDDIPGPQQLFGYIKNQLVGNCAGGFTGIRILADSGQPQNGAMYRRYTFVAKNHCGLLTPPCSVTFQATGICNPFCTALPATWGDPNDAIGGIAAAGALQILLTEHGPVVVGGGNHTVSAADAECVQEMLFGSGNNVFLPTAHSTCPLPVSLANPDGSLNNQLAANAMALQLNVWYNRRFNDRDLGIQTIQNLPTCLVQYPLLKDLGQHTTVQDLLDLTNLYLQGVIGNNSAAVLDWLNTALDNLNHFRVNCESNAPCERPDFSRNRENVGTKMQGIQLVPNPATEAVTITFESATAEEMQVQISDGRTVRLIHKLQAIKGLNTVNISLKDLPAGIYGVILQSENVRETLRLVKVVE